MADKEDKEKKYDLTRDPFGTGFEASDNIDGNTIEQFLKDRRKFLRTDDDEPLLDITAWKATAKAAVKNGFFTAPGWKVDDVGKMPPGQIRWLAEWCMEKYADLIRIPF